MFLKANIDFAYFLLHHHQTLSCQFLCAWSLACFGITIYFFKNIPHCLHTQQLPYSFVLCNILLVNRAFRGIFYTQTIRSSVVPQFNSEGWKNALQVCTLDILLCFSTKVNAGFIFKMSSLFWISASFTCRSSKVFFFLKCKIFKVGIL